VGEVGHPLLVRRVSAELAIENALGDCRALAIVLGQAAAVPSVTAGASDARCDPSMLRDEPELHIESGNGA